MLDSYLPLDSVHALILKHSSIYLLFIYLFYPLFAQTQYFAQMLSLGRSKTGKTERQLKDHEK